VAAAFSAGERDSVQVKTWLRFCRSAIPPLGHQDNEDYTHYYYGQVRYILGEDGYGKLFPKSKEADRLRWSDYRKDAFEKYRTTQQADGSWAGGLISPIYRAAVRLFVMQLDNGVLPAYQR
jgi:hypothetical protein